METSLHRQLKQHYATVTPVGEVPAGRESFRDSEALPTAAAGNLEVPLGDYRIDVVHGDTLIEIQHGSLAAIGRKIADLIQRHRVLVVKPLIVRKRIIKQDAPGGRVLSRRWSPKRATPLALFDELVYFTKVFPHHNLALEAPLVEVEEWRYPGHGRRRRWRPGDQQIEDQRLVQLLGTLRLETAADLRQLLPADLPRTFHTGHLAERLSVPRWVAQRIAYCFRQMGTALEVGKQGNTRLYRFPARRGIRQPGHSRGAAPACLPSAPVPSAPAPSAPAHQQSVNSRA